MDKEIEMKDKRYRDVGGKVDRKADREVAREKDRGMGRQRNEEYTEK